MKAIYLTALTLSLLFSSVSVAQKNCLNTLREAKELYEQGLINEIPQLLSDCMESGFTRAQRIEAYKLIILSYLFDDDQFAAEKMMDEFLRKFPEYEIMPNDPVEFVYLLESYQTSSLYSINLSFGSTLTDQRILEPFSLLDRNQTSCTNKTGAGYQFMLGVSRNLWKDFNVNIGVAYSQNNCSQEEVTEARVGERNFTFVELSVKEELTWINLPLTFSYRFGRGNMNGFGRFGGMVSYLSKAQLTAVRTHTGVNNLADEFDMRPFRMEYYYSLVFGTGLEYKIPRGFLVLDVRYNYGLQNLVNPDTRYSTPDLYSRYFYVDDNFALNSLSVMIGYHFRIYKSKKSRQ
jgi:hypothetical protein